MLMLTGCVAGGADAPTPLPLSTPEPTASSTPTEIPPTVTAAPSATATRLEPSPTPAPLCDVDEVSVFVTEFVDAFNAGDQERLDAMLPEENYPYAPAAPGPLMDQHQFRGFSIWNSIADRDTLLHELATRHAAGERWEIQYLVIQTDTARDPRWQVPELGEIAVQMIRQADDVAPHTIVGKGMINCVDQTLIFFFGGGDVADGITEESKLGEDALTPTMPATPTETPPPTASRGGSAQG